MTTVSGAVVWSAIYDAFGKATVDAGATVVNNLRFPGQYYDQEAGWHYNWERFYSPETGRYIIEDPIGLIGGDENIYRYVDSVGKPFSIETNLYAYTSNNPVNAIDPWGLYWFRQPWQRPGVVGRPFTIVPPQGRISEFIEKYVPAGYTFGELHDAFMDFAAPEGSASWRDWLSNIPSMLDMYKMALTVELWRSLGIIKQPTLPNQPTTSTRQLSPCK
jgi:RHS repeat-associated protein